MKPQTHDQTLLYCAGGRDEYELKELGWTKHDNPPLCDLEFLRHIPNGVFQVQRRKRRDSAACCGREHGKDWAEDGEEAREAREAKTQGWLSQC